MAFNQTLFPTQNQTNSTRSVAIPHPATWSVEPIFLCVCSVAGFLTNAVPLMACMKDRSLRTPFNLYVIHLLALNFLSSVLQNPLAVVIHFNPQGDTCMTFLLVQTLVNGACVKTHAVMAINRAWAIVHHLSYRSFHSKKFSVRVLIGLWVFQTTFTGISWLLNTFYYRRPSSPNGACLPPSAGVDAGVMINYVIPMAMILLSFICVSPLMLRRLKRQAAGGVQDLPKSRETGVTGVPVAMVSGEQFKSVPQTSMDVVPASNGGPAAAVKRGGLYQRSKAYVVLALLTGSVAICYLPQILYFLLALYAKTVHHPVVYAVVKVLYVSQTVLDPILFVASLANLRASIRKLMRGKCFT